MVDGFEVAEIDCAGYSTYRIERAVDNWAKKSKISLIGVTWKRAL